MENRKTSKKRKRLATDASAAPTVTTKQAHLAALKTTFERYVRLVMNKEQTPPDIGRKSIETMLEKLKSQKEVSTAPRSATDVSTAPRSATDVSTGTSPASLLANNLKDRNPKDPKIKGTIPK